MSGRCPTHWRVSGSAFARPSVRRTNWGTRTRPTSARRSRGVSTSGCGSSRLTRRALPVPRPTLDIRSVPRAVAVQRREATAATAHGRRAVLFARPESSEGPRGAFPQHRHEPPLHGVSRYRGAARQHRGGARDPDAARRHRADPDYARRDTEEDLRMEDGFLGRPDVRLAL